MGPGVESLKGHQWPIGQVVKTAASHAVNIGSNPVWVTKIPSKKGLTNTGNGVRIMKLLEAIRLLTYKRWAIAHPYEFVLIVKWVHLFPSRTQKLSTCTPTIVAGQLAVKIGNANTKPPT